VKSVVIGIGSNHDAAKNMAEGVRRLREVVHVETISPVYESEAAEDATAPPYLNAAARIVTVFSYDVLKAKLKSIEDALDRVRRDAEGKKSKLVTLDFDVLLYGDMWHEDLLRYAHAIVPAADVAPHHQHPVTGQSMQTLAFEIGSRGLLLREDIKL